PRAGPEIDQIAQLLALERVEDRRLDLVLIDMERADAMPFRGIGAEIGIGRLGALPLHGFEPRIVEEHRRVVSRHGIANALGELGDAPALRQAIEDPGALTEAVEQPGLAKELQVPRHARLALPQNIGELADGQLAARAKEQEPQSRWLGRRPQTG